MRAIELVAANPSMHTPDLDSRATTRATSAGSYCPSATTRAVTDATIAAIQRENM